MVAAHATNHQLLREVREKGLTHVKEAMHSTTMECRVCVHFARHTLLTDQLSQPKMLQT